MAIFPRLMRASVICGPIGCAVDFLCRLLHLKIILLKKPLRTALCNKAINNLKEDLQLELNILENIIDQSNTEQNDSIIELRKIYLYEIQKKTPIIKNTQCNQYGGTSNYKLFLLADDHRFSYDEILDNFLLENENFEILRKSDTLQWNIEVHANYTKTDIEENNIPFTLILSKI
ncbi:hypothetical protein IC765_15140 [Acinetobacter seifertii]|nr:hypothetical protein IC765_15140 [Acinetobacter seifertii]